MSEPSPLQLEKFAPYRLSVVSNLVSEVIASAYRSLFGLSVPEWRLVTLLANRGKATQSELAVASRMDKLTVSRAAIALVDRGLVARADNPGDKRSRILSLSRSGVELYEQVAPKALALEKELLQGFKAEEKRLLLSMLAKLEVAAVRLARQEAPSTPRTQP